MPFTFQEYFDRFETAAWRQSAQLRRLPNQGCIARFGEGPCLAILSGLHGDERSGPAAILEWLESLPPGGVFAHHFWIAPLLNDDGWDKRQREWRDLDLNRSFNGHAPDFLQIVMDDLKATRPRLLLDLHEDSDVDYAYVYHLTGDPHLLNEQLAVDLGLQVEPWSDSADWETASETFARRLGCDYSVTLEVPPGWPLPQRTLLIRRAIDWLQARPELAPG